MEVRQVRFPNRIPVTPTADSAEFPVAPHFRPEAPYLFPEGRRAFRTITESTNWLYMDRKSVEDDIRRKSVNMLFLPTNDDDEAVYDSDAFNASFVSTRNMTQFQRNTHLFRDEYNYWRLLGQAHIVAYRKAVDYYRKFLKREVTVNWQEQVDKAVSVDSVGEETERIQFNDIIRTVIKDLTTRQTEMLCYIIVQQDLDPFLDDDLQAMVYSVCGDNRPEDVKGIAKCMGLKLSKINVCTPLTKIRARIKSVFKAHNFVLANLA